MMAELLEPLDGLLPRRGGSMHIAVPGLGILGTNGIVGGGIPIATGAALRAADRGTRRRRGVFFGEGAAACGVFSEALNTASLWRLPLIMLCENNSTSS